MGTKLPMTTAELPAFFAKQGTSFSFSVDLYFLADCTGRTECNPAKQDHYYEVRRDPNKEITRNEMLRAIHFGLRAAAIQVPHYDAKPFSDLTTLPGTIMIFSINQQRLVAVTTDPLHNYMWVA